jgi:membrane fusion protein (multidrug efflux system)
MRAITARSPIFNWQWPYIKELQMKKQKVFLTLIMAALLLAPVSSFGQAEAKQKCPRKVQVEAMEVKGENFSEYAYFKNEIKPLTAELKAAVAGRIKEVLFKAGDEVKGGDILVTLDASALDKDIKEARTAVADWEKTLKTRKNWKERIEKAEKQAELKLGEAKANLAALQAKAELYAVKSAIAGRIEKLDAVAGMDVVAGTVLALVVNEGVMKLAITGDEVASLSDREKVFVRFETLASGVNGEVAMLGANQAEIVLDNSDRKLSAGLPATLKILKKEYSDVVVLKQDQVLQDGAGAYVYLAENNRAKKAAVTLGATEDGRVLAVSGVEKGWILIVKGLECLQDGKKIKIVNKLPEKALVKAEAKPEAKPEMAKQEIPAETQAAKAAGPKRIKVGVNLEYHYMTAEGFSGLYGRAIGGGMEISYLFGDKIDFFVGASYSGKSVNLSWDQGTSKYTMIPLSAGIRYYLAQKEKTAIFVGGGLQYVMYKDTTPFSELKENILGGSLLGGGNYKLSDSFYAQAMLKFTLLKKTLDITPAPDFQLDLTNIELKLGVFYTF